MDILLINSNPVVSRLMALCMRDEHYHLEEVSGAAQAHREAYDIVFVDDGSYTTVTEGFVSGLDAKRKVFLSSRMQEIPGFDMVIKKPFLPSQIIDILESVERGEEDMPLDDVQKAVSEPAEVETEDAVHEREESRAMEHTPDVEDPSGLTFEELGEHVDTSEESSASIFPLTSEERSDEEAQILAEEATEEAMEPVLDSDEIARIKALLEMDDAEEESVETLSDEEYEQRKIEAIKEDLIAQGLEIVEEEAIVAELGGEEMMPVISERARKKGKKATLTLQELEKLEMMFAYTIRKTKPKKLRKLLAGKKVKLKLKDNE
jgi:hypothetical protein